MKNCTAMGIRYQNGILSILDQQLLPQSETWVDVSSVQHMCDIIFQLKVRGAPLIGVAAAMALADYAEQGADNPQLQEAGAQLKASRPTAVNLAYCIDKQLAALRQSSDPRSIIAVAEQLFEEDKQLCERIAQNGAECFNPGDNIITHCNTGGLVTTGIGTALGVIKAAHELHGDIHVWVDETRPLLQGARLTAWELSQANVPYHLICDNMAASLMRVGRVQAVILGADRIAANGDAANKIGTYSLAVLAKHHGVPFYVAAPYTTIDPHTACGDDIVIEQRAAEEVRGVVKQGVASCWSVPDCEVYNPAFDVTPAELITAIITDSGVYEPKEVMQAVK